MVIKTELEEPPTNKKSTLKKVIEVTFSITMSVTMLSLLMLITKWVVK